MKSGSADLRLKYCAGCFCLQRDVFLPSAPQGPSGPLLEGVRQSRQRRDSLSPPEADAPQTSPQATSSSSGAATLLKAVRPLLPRSALIFLHAPDSVANPIFLKTIFAADAHRRTQTTAEKRDPIFPLTAEP